MDYQEILDEIGVPLLLSPIPLERGGYYLPNAFEYGEEGALVADGTLDGEGLELVVLHECGHKITGCTLSKLSAPQLHIVNEAKANRFMISRKAEDYLVEVDYMVNYFTPERFLQRFKLSVELFYDMADQEMKKIANKNKHLLVY